MKNKVFDINGFFFVKSLVNAEVFEEESDILNMKGSHIYNNSLTPITTIPVEHQVAGSFSRYNYPKYKFLHSQVRIKLENIIGAKLYNTYYYDRVYHPGQTLDKHVDRDSCEISVTVHISSNMKNPWDFHVESPSGKVASIVMNPGDGVIYKGCERPHWRNKMPGVKRNIVRKLFGVKPLYYHQIFFHYVLSNGYRSHFAFDTGQM